MAVVIPPPEGGNGSDEPAGSLRDSIVEAAREWRSVIAVLLIILVGAVIGLATILLGSVNSEFLDVLVSTTVTIYGFLIIGLVFVYEQQRWAWPVMWSVRDPERIALGSSFAIGLVTGIAGLVLGVALLAIDSTETATVWNLLGLDADAAPPTRAALKDIGWLVAPLSVTSIMVLGHAVRRVLVLLSPGPLSERVMRAARRAAVELTNESDEVSEDDPRLQAARRWVDALQRLTVDHLLNRNLEQYEAHVRSFIDLTQPLGSSGGRLAEEFLTSSAVDQLITIAGLAEEHRDSRIRALECALEILASDTAVSRLGSDERVRLAERVVLVLENVLGSPRPSATVSGLLLRLCLVLSPDRDARAGLFSDVLRDILPMRRPADVWSKVTEVLEDEVRRGRNGLEALEVAAAVAGLTDVPMARSDSTDIHGVASDGRSVAERVADLFDLLDIEAAARREGVRRTRLHQVIRAYAWVLSEAEGSELFKKGRRRGLIDGFVRLWMAAGADRQQQLPDEMDDAIRRFTPTEWTYIRFAVGIEEMRAGGRSPNRLNSRNPRRDEPITSQEVRDAIEMAFEVALQPGEERMIAEAIRWMLGQDRRTGMMALPTYVLLRRSFDALFDEVKGGGDLSSFRRVSDFIDIDRQANPQSTSAGFFNRGLEDCKWQCLDEARETLNMIGGRLLPLLDDPVGDPRLREAQGLFRALGLSVFALAVSIQEAVGLFVVGRFAELVPSFATAPTGATDVAGWSTSELLRLVHDTLGVSTIAMDLPVRIAPRRAGVEHGVPGEGASGEVGPNEAYVVLPDGSRALRLRDVWQLAHLRKVLHDIAALVGHARPILVDDALDELLPELQDAVLMGAEAEPGGEPVALDHLEQILAEAIVSLRRHHYWTWLKAVEPVDWDRIQPSVWLGAVEQLSTAGDDSIEPSGVFGLIYHVGQRMDHRRMPNEARLLLAEVLKKDLPRVGSSADRPFTAFNVGRSVAKSLETVTHQRVYDSELKFATAEACVRWADRTRQRHFAKSLSQRLAGRTNQNPLIMALRRALASDPRLAFWSWKELDLGPAWTDMAKRVQTQAALKRQGVGTEFEARVLFVHETYAMVQVPGGEAVLPVAEVGWTNIPDLRMLLEKGEAIRLVIVTASRQPGDEDEAQLVVSRKPLMPDPRPAIREAIKSGVRQDAVYLGVQPGKKTRLLRLTGFGDMVVARLEDTGVGAPVVGDQMRVLIKSFVPGGLVFAKA